MQPHPEVNEGAQMIGWQPVFATTNPAKPPSNQNLIPIMLGLGASALLVATAGGVLFKQHQEMDSQKAVWQQEAIAQERARMMECIAPK